MKKKYLFFRRYFPLTLVAVTSTVLALGLVALSLARTQNFAIRSQLAEITAHLLEGLDPDEFRLVLRQLGNVQSQVPLLKMNTWVLDSQGLVLYSSHEKNYPYSWALTPRPLKPYDFTIFREHSNLLTSTVVARVPGESERYLVIGEYYDTKSPRVIIFALGSVALAIVAISILVTMLFYFFYFRKRSHEASYVLSELKHGNLKARFSVKMLDEAGSLMNRFNEMADEIESLVEDLQIAQASRANLLQELAHDVRTPLTSLRTLLETLQTHSEQMSSEKRLQCFELANAEIHYLERLIKDLLMLAILNDPHYKLAIKDVSLDQLIRKNLVVFHSQHENIEVLQDYAAPSPVLQGDGMLLDRMMRNALSNAFKFTKTKIAIHLTEKDDRLAISISDDGPGFSEQGLRQFGIKKFSRVMTKVTDDDQIGLGLGSVIMKEIVALHGGTLTARNVPVKDGTGAEISIEIPRFHTSSTVR